MIVVVYVQIKYLKYKKILNVSLAIQDGEEMFQNSIEGVSEYQSCIS